MTRRDGSENVMRFKALTIICLACWLAAGGCKSRQAASSQQPQAPDRPAAVKATTLPARAAAPVKARGAAQVRGGPARLAAAATTTASQQAAARSEYAIFTETAIADTSEKAQAMAADVVDLSPGQEDRLDALMLTFEAKSQKAYEALDELDASPADQWHSQKAQVDRSLAEMHAAYSRLDEFVRAVSKPAPKND